MKHLFAGLVCAGLGVWGIVSWWDVFGLVMRGVVPFTLLMVGLIAILAGYRRSSQRQQAAATPAEAPPPAPAPDTSTTAASS
jgi:hypothetical protein